MDDLFGTHTIVHRQQPHSPVGRAVCGAPPVATSWLSAPAGACPGIATCRQKLIRRCKYWCPDPRLGVMMTGVGIKARLVPVRGARCKARRQRCFPRWGAARSPACAERGPWGVDPSGRAVLRRAPPGLRRYYLSDPRGGQRHRTRDAAHHARLRVTRGDPVDGDEAAVGGRRMASPGSPG